MLLKLSKRALLAAMIFQAKIDPRYYLCGICFAPDGKLYSTDGHRAFIGEHQSEGVTENIIVQIKGPRFTQFDHAEIDMDTGILTYCDEHGEGVAVAMVRKVDGRFPDVNRAIPTGNDPVSEIAFNAGYLSDIEKAAKLYNAKWPGIVIKPNGNAASAIIELSNTFEKASVVIMPMRI
jgi:DNA polymerase III sliding clamp (beta) subunit (PCNA family)